MATPVEGERGADLVARHGRLGRRTVLVSGLTLVSRLLGFVREMISAALFGDRSAVFDAFVTAWRVPNLFRRFLGEGALSTSFQTALTRVDGDHGEAAGRRLFLDTFALLVKLLLGLCLVVMGAVALMPDAMPVTGWRWLGADPGPVRELTLRVMPFVILICASAFVGGALQVRGHFSSPAWAPATLNLAWIATLVVVGFLFGWRVDAEDMQRHLAMARVLSWGVLAAGVVQLAVQVPALARTGFIGRGAPAPAPRSAAGATGARDLLWRAAPLALGAAVYQINVMVDGLMAESLLPDGGPTLHYYANRVQQFPMALIAAAATSAVFPALQAHGHTRDLVAVRALHDRTHRAIAFVALPASIGLFVLAGPVIAACFQHGAFREEGVARGAAALRMLALAILPAGATGLVARTYYALGDFKTPVRISSLMLLVNVALNLVFIELAGMDVDGLALSTAVTSWCGLALLAPGLTRRLGLPAGAGGWAASAARLAVAGAASGAAAWGLEAPLRAALGRAPALALAIAAGAAAYFVAALLMRAPELAAVRRLGRRARG
jgi:putative peptidoglycan lipid II flippase